MFKKIAGIAVLALLFSCSSDDNSSDPGDKDGNGGGVGDGPKSEGKIIANFSTKTAFCTYTFVYAENGATIENPVDPYNDANKDGIYDPATDGYLSKFPNSQTGCGSGDGAMLKSFKANGGDLGIAFDFYKNQEPSESCTPLADISGFRYFKYSYKGVAHQFRLQKDETSFWMQKFAASDKCIEVIIDVTNDEFFFPLEGSGPYDDAARKTVTSAQWVPDVDLNTEGTLAVDSFYGYEN